jgi:tagatose 1,6-diphosphate aldolase
MSESQIGKKRCFEQISTSSGYLGILAIDHREDTLGQALAEAGLASDWSAMADFKVASCQALAGDASGILLDPVAGIQATVKQGVMPGQTGLLVTAEDLGFVVDEKGGKRSELTPGVNASLAQRLGGQALKLLVYARPDRPEALSRQEAMVKALADDCARSGLLLVVEAVTYRLPDESDHEYQSYRPDTVIEIARLAESWGADILKLEFPWPLNTADEEKLAATGCKELSDTLSIPWAILSAGVDFEMFKRQVATAIENGAKGFIAGRAVWAEAASLTENARVDFLKTTARNRLVQLMDLLPS